MFPTEKSHSYTGWLATKSQIPKPYGFMHLVFGLDGDSPGRHLLDGCASHVGPYAI